MISIVIPMYNSSKTIGDTIRSVINQTYTNFEVIVVNDGSIDNSYENTILSIKDDNRFKILSQVNSGVSQARNAGILYSHFDYIAFLDSDDQWEPTYLREIVRLIEQYPLSIAYATGYKKILKYGDEDEKIWLSNNGIKSGELNTLQLISEGKFPFYTSSIVIKKTILNSVGNFPIGVSCGEDIITWIKIALKGSIAYSSTVSVKYFLSIDDDRSRRRKNDKNDFVGNTLSLLLVTNHIKEIKLIKYQWHIMRYLNALLTEKRISNVKPILCEFFKIVRAYPFKCKGYLYFGLLILPKNTIDRHIMYRI